MTSASSLEDEDAPVNIPAAALPDHVPLPSPLGPSVSMDNYAMSFTQTTHLPRRPSSINRGGQHTSGGRVRSSSRARRESAVAAGLLPAFNPNLVRARSVAARATAQPAFDPALDAHLAPQAVTMTQGRFPRPKSVAARRARSGSLAPSQHHQHAHDASAKAAWERHRLFVEMEQLKKHWEATTRWYAEHDDMCFLVCTMHQLTHMHTHTCTPTGTMVWSKTCSPRMVPGSHPRRQHLRSPLWVSTSWRT